MCSNISIFGNLYIFTQYIQVVLLFIAGYGVCKVQQVIANDRPEIAQRIIEKAENSSGRQDLNLRPSAPKAPAKLMSF